MSAGTGIRPVWITWERQRRSRELARALRCDFWEMLASGPYPVRAAWLAVRTLKRLVLARPSVVIVQNPSLVLATLACACRKRLGYRLVVDRHSSFKLHTVRAADLTVVTNPPLARLVEEWGGTALVLPDPLPRLDLARRMAMPPGEHVVFPAGYGSEEPLAEVLAAAARFPNGVTLHVTGDATRAAAARQAAPANVHFTGFLPEEQYQALLLSCDVVLALTRQPNTLLCAAYEAVALGRPLVLSDHVELARYFNRGRVLADGTPEGIAAAVAEALGRAPQLALDSAALREQLASQWQDQFARLVARLETLAGHPEEVSV